MGTILKAACSCGYEADELLVGKGMLDLGTRRREPAVCKHDEEVFAIDYLDESRHNCPKCRKNVQFYNEKSLRGERIEKGDRIHHIHSYDKTFLLATYYHYCPKCKKVNLRFYQVGKWD